MPSEEPLRMSLGNLDTGESITAQYNPTEVETAISAVFNRIKTFGGTFEEMQFSNVTNAKIMFSLVFDSRSSRAIDLANVEGFLASLIYPRTAVSAIATGAPPLVLFSWPNWIALVTRMPSFSQRTTRFAKDGRPESQTYKVELEAHSTRRIGSEIVRRSAFKRAA